MMNRRGFLTSALKATAAGILVPEHLFGRSMVAGFHPRIFYGEHITMGVDPASDLDTMMIALTLAFGKEKHVFVSPAVFPTYEKAYKHVIKIAKAAR